LARHDRLAGGDPGGQDPALLLAAEDVYFAALESTRGDADIDQSPPLVEEDGTPRYRHGVLGLRHGALHDGLDEQSPTPDRGSSIRGTSHSHVPPATQWGGHIHLWGGTDKGGANRGSGGDGTRRIRGATKGRLTRRDRGQLHVRRWAGRQQLRR